jgi:hypothetical protein
LILGGFFSDAWDCISLDKADDRVEDLVFRLRRLFFLIPSSVLCGFLSVISVLRLLQNGQLLETGARVER